jgi:hypothetical protein
MPVALILCLWTLVGFIFAALTSAILARLAAALTRNAPRSSRVTSWVRLYPFVCLLWAVAVFTLQAQVNERVFHKDPAVGDLWRCPLPNGYAMTMIDEPDFASIYRMGDVRDELSPKLNEVRRLQIATRLMLGGSGGRHPSNDEMSSYFLLDVQTKELIRFASAAELGGAARLHGVDLDLEPVWRIYNQYRYGWFDMFAGMLFSVPALLGFIIIVFKVVQLRRTRRADPLIA